MAREKGRKWRRREEKEGIVKRFERGKGMKNGRDDEGEKGRNRKGIEGEREGKRRVDKNKGGKRRGGIMKWLERKK